ncbi:MAG: F0F1 ATP synthase subunit delta [Streptosporangiaceae bacterium]
MRGASRAALAAAKERLSAAVAGGTAMAGGAARAAAIIGDDLLGVTGLLDAEPGLRRALSDPSRDAAERAGLAQTLLSGRISDGALDQVRALSSARWSDSGNLADATEHLGVLAIAESADIAGQLDELEDQLFRFGRIVGANPELRSALSNGLVPEQGRRAIVTELLTGKVVDAALRLITQATVRPRGRSLDASLEFYANLVAELRERLVAEVHVAVPLTDSQRGRLVAALAAAYGHDVHLNVVLDPRVLGGMSVRIGDELINGSVAGRLTELRRDLAA